MNEWVYNAVVYQIYPRSFKDTNNDGIGDLKGVIEKLDYLQDLGINTLWLCPVYQSPNHDNGYDISDYYSILPEFGTMEDMDQLIAACKEKEIRILMDLVINHTSDEHEWFKQSLNPNSTYRDFYYWRPRKKDGKPPNNWTGFFGGHVWEQPAGQEECYLHLFSKHQVDLNFHNPNVREAVKDVMRFWLDKGVSGFRCDVITIINKMSLADGKPSIILTGREHYLTNPGTHELLHEFYEDVLQHYSTFTVGEATFCTIPEAKALTNQVKKELDMVFAFEIMESDQHKIKWFPKKLNRKQFIHAIHRWQQGIAWNANYFENHDLPRGLSRFGDTTTYRLESSKMLAALLLTLRGTPFIYQGQEIGMSNYPFLSIQDVKDIESHDIYQLGKRLKIPDPILWKMIYPKTRDHARTPMQWNDHPYAGFSQHLPWLAVNPNYIDVNVEQALQDQNSVWYTYKALIQLRKDHLVLQKGDYHEVEVGNDFLVFERRLGDDVIRIFINLSNQTRTSKYRKKGRVLYTNYDIISLEGIMKPYEATILHYQKQAK